MRKKIDDLKDRFHIMEEPEQLVNFIDFMGVSHNILSINNTTASIFAEGIEEPICKKEIIPSGNGAYVNYLDTIVKLDANKNPVKVVETNTYVPNKRGVNVVSAFSSIFNAIENTKKDPIVGSYEDRLPASIYGDFGLADAFDLATSSVTRRYYSDDGLLLRESTNNKDTKYSYDSDKNLKESITKEYSLEPDDNGAYGASLVSTYSTLYNIRKELSDQRVVEYDKKAIINSDNSIGYHISGIVTHTDEDKVYHHDLTITQADDRYPATVAYTISKDDEVVFETHFGDYKIDSETLLITTYGTEEEPEVLSRVGYTTFTSRTSEKYIDAAHFSTIKDRFNINLDPKVLESLFEVEDGNHILYVLGVITDTIPSIENDPCTYMSREYITLTNGPLQVNTHYTKGSKDFYDHYISLVYKDGDGVVVEITPSLNNIYSGGWGECSIGFECLSREDDHDILGITEGNFDIKISVPIDKLDKLNKNHLFHEIENHLQKMVQDSVTFINEYEYIDNGILAAFYNSFHDYINADVNALDIEKIRIETVKEEGGFKATLAVSKDDQGIVTLSSYIEDVNTGDIINAVTNVVKNLNIATSYVRIFYTDPELVLDTSFFIDSSVEFNSDIETYTDNVAGFLSSMTIKDICISYEDIREFSKTALLI